MCELGAHRGTDRAEHDDRGVLGLGPVGEVLGDRGVEAELRQPRLAQVVVDLAASHRAHHWLGLAVVVLDHQHPFRLRVQSVGPGQELQTGHLLHLLVDDQNGDALVRMVRRLLEPGQGPGGRGLGDDRAITAEPAAHVRGESCEHQLVVAEQDQQRLDHIDQRTQARVEKQGRPVPARSGEPKGYEPHSQSSRLGLLHGARPSTGASSRYVSECSGTAASRDWK